MLDKDPSAASRRGLRARVRRHGLIVPLYFLLAVFFTYPTITVLNSAIGGQLDALENYWNLWWTWQALVVRGENPYYSTIMYYPFGIPLYFHTYNFANSLLSLPLQACCGTAAAYNLLNMFAIAMAGITMYALAFSLTGRRAAALIAGLIFAFSPFMAFHLAVGQPFILSLEWIPLYLLALLHGLRRRWPVLLGAAALLAVIGLTDWHYLVFTTALTLLVVLYEAVRLRSWHALLPLASKLALVGGTSALLLSPLLVAAIREVARDPYAIRPIEDSVYHSTDVLAFFLPSIFHPLWGAWARQVFTGWTEPGAVVNIATLGYAALVLALLGGVRRWRQSALFVLIFVVFAILALGPYLQIDGSNSFEAARPIPLPYLLFHQLPFMNLVRFPSRFLALVMLALAVLAGQGVAWLWDRPRVQRWPPRVRAALAGVLALLVLFEYWPAPFPTTPIGPEAVPPFYRQLGAEAEQYAIIEVPYLQARSLFYQTYHNKVTVGGRIARPKPHPWLDARAFAPLLRVAQPAPEMGADTRPDAWQEALVCQNVRYAVFYRDSDVSRSRLRNVEQALFAGAKPAYEDATLRAYRLPAVAPRELYWTPVFGEWYDAERNGEGVFFRWMQGDHGTLLAYPCAGDTRATIRFTAYTDDQPRTLELRINGELVRTVALQRQLATPVEQVAVLHAGENRIELRSVEPAIPAASLGYPDDPRVISISLSRVEIVPGGP